MIGIRSAMRSSNSLQRDRWKNLTVPSNFFVDCKKQPINYICAESYKRKVYFSECENIAFQNKDGEDI